MTLPNLAFYSAAIDATLYLVHQWQLIGLEHGYPTGLGFLLALVS